METVSYFEQLYRIQTEALMKRGPYANFAFDGSVYTGDLHYIPIAFLTPLTRNQEISFGRFGNGDPGNVLDIYRGVLQLEPTQAMRVVQLHSIPQQAHQLPYYFMTWGQAVDSSRQVVGDGSLKPILYSRTDRNPINSLEALKTIARQKIAERRSMH